MAIVRIICLLLFEFSMVKPCQVLSNLNSSKDLVNVYANFGTLKSYDIDNTLK